MFHLRTLPSSFNLRGKRVLLRLDWNVPVHGRGQAEDSLKIERSLATLRGLVKRGAVVIILTHLGRPKKQEQKFSTRHLVPILKRRHGVSVTFHQGSISQPNVRARLKRILEQSKPGSLHLLENVRFEAGEEKNDLRLAKQYASIADLFINDAFASYRPHTSVVNLARVMPSYAGPGLNAEVNVLRRLLHHPRRPFIAIVGGLKLSSKLPVLRSLLKTCDRVLLGGAMSMSVVAARGGTIGQSMVEPAAVPLAKTIMKNKKLLLPSDVMVMSTTHSRAKPRRTSIETIGARDQVVDVGSDTLKNWGQSIRHARTILWNGPIGITEIPAFAKGSNRLAHLIAQRGGGSSFCVAGGSDTIPVIFKTRTQNRFDYISTGGGALLEFLATKGRMPSLLPLYKK